MQLSELIKRAQETLSNHGDLPVTILRSEGRTFSEVSVSGFVLMLDSEDKPLNYILDDADFMEARPKVE